MKRRDLIKNGLITGATAVGLPCLYTWQIEPFWLEFVHQSMVIKNLPTELIGKTVMQISDVHVGDRFDYKYIINSFKKAQSLSPDIVVYTGDFTDFKGDHQYQQLKEVFKSTVIGKIATIGILGNHDYGPAWSNNSVADNIHEILEKSGINILRNEYSEIQGLRITGLDDFWSPKYSPRSILSKIDQDGANIVLCHNPDVLDEPVWQGYDSWILSGHTHGGQCKPPFLKAPMLPVKNKDYDQGLINLADGRKLYINRALGHLWQVRFNVRPEITIFTLQQA